MSVRTSVVAFLAGLAGAVVGAAVMAQVMAPTSAHATTSASPAPQTVLVQPQTTVLSHSLSDQLAAGGAYAPRP